jgi:hypothetical protein
MFSDILIRLKQDIEIHMCSKLAQANGNIIKGHSYLGDFIDCALQSDNLHLRQTKDVNGVCCL